MKRLERRVSRPGVAYAGSLFYVWDDDARAAAAWAAELAASAPLPQPSPRSQSPHTVECPLLGWGDPPG